MTQDQDKKALRLFNRLSRFDKIVLGVVLVMVLSTALVLLVDLSGEKGYRIVFLRTGGANVANVWMIDPETGDETQLTDAPIGVRNYDVSADGQYIAYSARDFQTNTVDIYRLHISTGNVTRLTNCIEESSICDVPLWRADGLSIAYERSSLDARDTRIWLLDIKQLPARTFPLISDPSITGSNATWSDDGEHIGFYASVDGTPGILVYDFPANPYKTANCRSCHRDRA